MDAYISKTTLHQAIEYFRGKTYSKPEQIGLYFYFKAVGLNHHTFTVYDKWGVVDESHKRDYTRKLYDLAGVFDAKSESGLKRTALFPFSIQPVYKAASFYNGATPFSRLGSRIYDTLDNALVSTLIMRNSTVSNQLRFRDDSVQKLLQDYLKGSKIPVEWFSAWYYRFWKISLPNEANSQDFHDICILSLLLDLGISVAEYDTLFHYAPGRREIGYEAHMISGDDLRSELHINQDVAPEISSDMANDYMPTQKSLTSERCAELLRLRGSELTDERIREILSKEDEKIMSQLQDEQPLTAPIPEDTPVLCIPHSPRANALHPLNQIIYGAPGTGKTYSSIEYAMAIVENREVDLSQRTREQRQELMAKYSETVRSGQVVFTTFHQSYGYEEFVQGIRPDAKAGAISFKKVDGVFKTIADTAMRTPDKNYVIIIDEINRGNISKIFGELITLIEDDKRYGELNQLSVTLPLGERFAVPNNLYVIGTMNSADKSISLIDTALRRRFVFVEMAPNESLIGDATLKAVLLALNGYIKKELRSTDLLIGHAYFIGKTATDLGAIMNNNIIPLLYEYFYDDEAKVRKALDCLTDTDYVIDGDYRGRIRIKKKD